MSRPIVTVTVGVALVALVAFAVGGDGVHGGHGAPSALGPPHFVEEAAAAGLDHTYSGGFTFAVGGGVAAFGCNGDGKPDLYIAGGGGPAALFRNDSPVGGALQFTRLPDPVTDLTGVTGAYPLDIDGDGIVDLVVLRAGQSVLLKGTGECRFEDASDHWQFNAGRSYATAFSATWESASGLPTLALGNYLGLDPNGEGTRECADSSLIRPTAAGSSYDRPIVLTPGYCALSMLFSDWARSGQRDLRVSNDRHYYDNSVGQEQLWRIQAREPPALYTDADGWRLVQIEGMGIASHDLTGDGYPEVVLTSQASNRLQTLAAGPGQPAYREIGNTLIQSTTWPFTGGDRLPSTAWHPEFQDVNNDGFMDLFISKGNVDSIPDFAVQDPSNLLLGQPDGTFVEGAEGAGILSFARGRGAALVDFNLDGLLDLVEVNYGDPVRLWRSMGAGDTRRSAPMGHWLGLRLLESGSNRDAIGAWVEVRAGDGTLSIEVTAGGGHAGGQLGWIHVGLGSAADATVRVRWPDGEIGPWQLVAANQFAILERGAPDAQPWHAGQG